MQRFWLIITFVVGALMLLPMDRSVGASPTATYVPTPYFSPTPTITLTPRPAYIFIVNSVADSDDGMCTGTLGGCTLREAIHASNISPGYDTIAFNIPSTLSFVISPTSPLPALLQTVIIDGTTQPGFVDRPIIELRGDQAGWSHGLQLHAPNIVVRGLVINRFSYAGLHLREVGIRVEGNWIGLGLDGATAYPNHQDGIEISAPYPLIGGATTAARNIISGNGRDGIHMDGDYARYGSAVVQGNYIGVDVTGNAAVPNGGSGVYMLNAYGAQIGGTEAGTGNLISGNGWQGITLVGTATDGTHVEGNRIGTSADGLRAIPNRLDGIFLGTGDRVTIGGTSLGAPNLISGNGRHGIWLDYTDRENKVLGNWIGVDATGRGALGNGGHGVYLATYRDHVGGEQPGMGNIIAFNTLSGVATLIGRTDNSIRRNQIYANGQLGIDLDDEGVTPNDAPSTDFYGLLRQTFPLLTAVRVTEAGTTVSGVLRSQPSRTYQIDIFTNPACDASGYGEGQTFLASTSVTTDATGDGSFTAAIPLVILLGEAITATATDHGGNTSEFSQCLAAGTTATPTNTATVTLTPTITQTPTVTETPTVTPTSSVTQTPTSSQTPTMTATATPSLTLTKTSTVTATPTTTLTPTASPTYRPTPLPRRARPAVWHEGAWLFRDSLSDGRASQVVFFGLATDIPLLCDWNGDGLRTPGVFRNGVWFTHDLLATSLANRVFGYGLAGDFPICGDWDGDGVETPGVVRGQVWYLRQTNTSGVADLMFAYGLVGDEPLVGDWNGDGLTTIGVRRSNAWYLRNSNAGGSADMALLFGAANDQPLVGDWDGDGDETPGVYRAGLWFLHNSFTAEPVDLLFLFGDRRHRALIWH